MEDVVGFELRKGKYSSVVSALLKRSFEAFWDYGHDLFLSTPESFPAAFLEGDVFNPEMI